MDEMGFFLIEAAELVQELLDASELAIEAGEADSANACSAKQDSDAAFTALLGIEGFETSGVDGELLDAALANIFEQDHEIDYTDPEERAAALAAVGAQRAVAELILQSA